jgi:hypothetical protein
MCTLFSETKNFFRFSLSFSSFFCSPACYQLVVVVLHIKINITVHGKSIYTPVFVWQKMHSAAILGIDGISHFGIAYSSRKEFFFFDEILEQKDAERYKIQTKT